MATLQVKGMDDALYEGLKRRAELQHRSVSQEVVHLIESHLGAPGSRSGPESATEAFLKLAGVWSEGDEVSAEEAIAGIRESRVNRRAETDAFD